MFVRSRIQGTINQYAGSSSTGDGSGGQWHGSILLIAGLLFTYVCLLGAKANQESEDKRALWQDKLSWIKAE